MPNASLRVRENNYSQGAYYYYSPKTTIMTKLATFESEINKNEMFLHEMKYLAL